MIGHKQILTAVNWSALEAVVRHGVGILVLIFLARILTPADFGLTAMLALFVAAANLLVDSGFNQALIQRQKTTPIEESSIFIFTIFMATIVAVALCIFSPVIANFYHQPILEQIMYWMALNVFINSTGSIHLALLTKELDFKTIARVGMFSSILSGVTAIYLAINGWGVWSLVGHTLVGTATSVMLLWSLHSWRPQASFSFSALYSYFQYGGYLLWTGTLHTVHTNLYAMLIGKLHSPQDAGYFSQAQRLQMMPVTIMTNVVGRVAFPVFSISSDDKPKLARGLRKALISVMFINIPFMLSLIILAEPLIVGFLGEKWLPSVPVLQVLSIVGLLWPLHMLNINVLKAQGNSGLVARIQLIKLTLAIGLLIALSPYGILAIAYGQIIASVLGIFINTHYTKKFLNYGSIQQFHDLLPIVVASIPMVMLMWVINNQLEYSNILKVMIAVPICVAIYFLVCIFAKLEPIEIIRSLLGSRVRIDSRD